MKVKSLFWILAFALAVSVVGCQKQGAEPVADADVAAPSTNERGGGMDATNELVLGTLKLEGSGEAVTPAQAAKLLPLWQIVQSGSLQGAAEMEAVLKQIKGAMTEPQLTAIEGMALTFQDIQAWMQEQGIEMPARPEGQQGGAGAFQNMSEEERAKMREEFQNMSDEQRATRMAELGFQRPEGGGQGGAPGGGMTRGGGGQFNVLLDPLIGLLTERAAQ